MYSEHYLENHNQISAIYTFLASLSSKFEHIASMYLASEKKEKMIHIILTHLIVPCIHRKYCTHSEIHSGVNTLSKCWMIQNPFLTAQSTQMKSVISVPIKDFIHHYPRALFNDIPRVGAHFYDIPGLGRTFTTYPGRGAV